MAPVPVDDEVADVDSLAVMDVRPDHGIFLEETNRSDTRIVDVGPMNFAVFNGFAEVRAGGAESARCILPVATPRQPLGDCFQQVDVRTEIASASPHQMKHLRHRFAGSFNANEL